MQVGIVGLGKMGYRMAERLLEQDYNLAVTDIDVEAIKRASRKGAIGIMSFKELVQYIDRTRMVLVSVPEQSMENIVEEAYQHMSGGDIVIDISNSFYKDTQRRAAVLKNKGIYFIDVGISGGVSGAREGGCLMVGGEQDAVVQAAPFLEALSRNGKYAYFGPSGAGHLVKGYHNLVEYGCLQALAEGLASIAEVSQREGLEIKLADVCCAWSNGSIVESRLTRDAQAALERNPRLDGISGSVYGRTEQEMQELVKLAGEYGISTPSCSAALEARIQSQKNPTEVGKLINATRKEFGGHEEWEHGK